VAVDCWAVPTSVPTVTMTADKTSELRGVCFITVLPPTRHTTHGGPPFFRRDTATAMP
jgi:hypothetical protein